MITAVEIPEIIQGGMGVAVSSWRLARAVAESGQLGVVSGTALDLVLARRLQNGDEGGHVRRALHHFPDQNLVDRTLSRYFLDGGRAEGESYAPILKMTLTPHRSSQELLILGGFVETWLAKEGHDGPIGINCLEKIQLSTPGTLYGAMLAGIDVVLMGAGVPRAIPHLLDTLAVHGDVRFAIDVADAGETDYALAFEPQDLVESDDVPLSRPVFLAIVSAHVLATYLARDPEIRPDGFIVEASNAGGHNAPPRQQLLDGRGDLVFGPRDEPDLQKIAKAGLPHWIAGVLARQRCLMRRAKRGRGGSKSAQCSRSVRTPASIPGSAHSYSTGSRVMTWSFTRIRWRHQPASHSRSSMSRARCPTPPTMSLANACATSVTSAPRLPRTMERSITDARVSRCTCMCARAASKMRPSDASAYAMGSPQPSAWVNSDAMAIPNCRS